MEELHVLERRRCIRYHVYKELWAAGLGEVLTCEREPDNASDRYAVAVSTHEHAHVRIFDISYRKYFVILNIRSLKYFAILIFVALCDYENISTANISRFTVYSFSAASVPTTV